MLRTILAGDGAGPAGTLHTRHSLRESRSKLRILLAEDNPVNKMVAVRILEKLGHTVTAVENGKLALEALDRERFDVVLMDIQMPVMDGLRAVEEIRFRERGTGSHIPVIALTAHAMKGDEQRCIEAGMDAYLAKPVKSEDLRTKIDSLVA